MTRDSWILGLAGVAFGILIGWIIGSQSARSSSPAAFAPQQQTAGAPQQGQQAQAGQPGQGNAGGAPAGVQAPPPLDETQVKALGTGRHASEGRRGPRAARQSLLRRGALRRLDQVV